MDKQQKIKKRRCLEEASKGKNLVRFRTIVVLAAVGIILFAGLVLSCGKKAEEGAAKERATSTESAHLPEGERDLKRLVGRWLRPDGGYIIDIQNVRANGELDAGYFNPRPINVSKAKATAEGEKVEVFIELYDEGYPGSTYTLTYDSKSDALFGTYFQAALGQNFEVVFVRMK